MSALDDIIVNTKSAAETIGKKTGEIIDSAKLRLQIADIKKDLSKAYEELGIVAFNLCGIGTLKDDNLEEHCLKIKELLSQLESAQKLKESKNVTEIVCPLCKEKYTTEVTYCSKCGSRINIK